MSNNDTYDEYHGNGYNDELKAHDDAHGNSVTAHDD